MTKDISESVFLKHGRAASTGVTYSYYISRGGVHLPKPVPGQLLLGEHPGTIY